MRDIIQIILKIKIIKINLAGWIAERTKIKLITSTLDSSISMASLGLVMSQVKALHRVESKSCSDCTKYRH